MSDPKIEFYKQGMGHFGKGEYAPAIEAYKSALEFEPDWTDCLHALAMAQAKGGDLDTAIATAKRIVELTPDDHFANTSLSMFYMQQGKIEEAEKEGAIARMKAWKEELKTNPDAPPPSDPTGLNVTQ